MPSNTPNETQRKFASHKSSRQPSLTPAQRARAERDAVAREVEELRAHQAELRAAMYARMGKRPPDPDRLADFADEFGGEAA